MTDPWSGYLDAETKVRARVLATMDKTLQDLIGKQSSLPDGPLLDVDTIEHVRRLLRAQVSWLSWQETVAHNAQVAEEALARDARPDSREELLALRDALLEKQIRTSISDRILQETCDGGDQCQDRFCPGCIRRGQARRDAAIARGEP